MKIGMIKFILTETVTKRLPRRWVTAWAIALGMLSVPGESLGQVTITAKDMFGKEGEAYQRVCGVCDPRGPDDCEAANVNTWSAASCSDMKSDRTSVRSWGLSSQKK